MGGTLEFMHGVALNASGSSILVAYWKQLNVERGKRWFCLLIGYDGGEDTKLIGLRGLACRYDTNNCLSDLKPKTTSISFAI
jgi:hypothetical protein